MKTILATAAAAALLVATSGAQAAVIDFEGYADSLNSLQTVEAIGDLQFVTNFYQYVARDDYAQAVGNARNGTSFFLNGFHGLTITKAGGGGFTLNALDLGRGDYSPDPLAVTFTFNYAGGGSSTATYNPAGTSFQNLTFALPELTSVTVGATPGYFALDNIQYDAGGPVPEPAAWALMIAGFGLAGATLRVRRRLAV